MANIIIPVTKIEAPFHGFGAAAAVGQSSTAGTAEIFEAAFPVYNESCYIVATNANAATVQLKVLSNGAEGYVEENYTLMKNMFAVIGVDPAYMKQPDSTVHVKITPNSATTVSACGVKLYAFYDYDTNALSGNYRWVDYQQLNEDLTSVADKIRSKTGGTAELHFPDEFNAAIDTLEAGEINA